MTKRKPLKPDQPDIHEPQAPEMTKRMMHVDTKKRDLPVHLTDEEQREAADHAADFSHSVAKLEDALTKLSKKYRDDIKTAKGNQRYWSEQVRTCTRVEPCAVIVVYDFEENLSRTIRTDTNQVIESDTLTEEQAKRGQGVLPIGLTGARPHSDHNAVADAIEAEVASARPPSEAFPDILDESMRPTPLDGRITELLKKHGSMTRAKICKALADHGDRESVTTTLKEMKEAGQVRGNKSDPWSLRDE